MHRKISICEKYRSTQVKCVLISSVSFSQLILRFHCLLTCSDRLTCRTLKLIKSENIFVHCSLLMKSNLPIVDTALDVANTVVVDGIVDGTVDAKSIQKMPTRIFFSSC